MGKYFYTKIVNLDTQKIKIMTNQLTYSEILDLCADKKITFASLAKGSGMTPHGLKYALQDKTVKGEVISTLCKILNITPNHFFNWDADPTTYNTTQVGVMNNQSIGAAGIEILQQQLQTKDEQIKQLLQLLNKQ